MRRFVPKNCQEEGWSLRTKMMVEKKVKRGKQVKEGGEPSLHLLQGRRLRYAPAASFSTLLLPWAKSSWDLSQVAGRSIAYYTVQVNIYKSSDRGHQGKEGECGGWTCGTKYPKSNTPPQSPCSPCRSRRRDKPQCQVGIQRAIQEKT